jgi:hypothetical protein
MSDRYTFQNALAVQDMNSLAISHSASPLRSSQLLFKGSVSANIGKRRALAGPILSSPARQGHRSRMAEIFSKARAQLDSMSDVSASPRRSALSAQPSITEPGEVKYPTLRLLLGPPHSLDLPAATSQAKESHELVFPGLMSTLDSGTDFSRKWCRGLAKETDTHRTSPPRFYPQRRLRRDAPDSAETLKPERYYASLGLPAEAPQSDTALSEYSSEHTSSSASWTGDSEFYYPKPQPLPQQQRQCSVSEWLDRLPEKLERLGEGTEDDEEDEAPMSPLSPHVELERGSRRRRRIEKQVRKRCVSYDDEDIFGLEA